MKTVAHYLLVSVFGFAVAYLLFFPTYGNGPRFIESALAIQVVVLTIYYFSRGILHRPRVK